jgi:hypothetical protein
VTSELTPRGALSLNRVPLIERPVVSTFAEAVRYGTPFGEGRPQRLFGRRKAMQKARWQAANAENFKRSLIDQIKFEANALPNRLNAIGHLWLAKLNLDGSLDDLGLVSCRVVTDTGVAFIVDAFQNLVELETMKFHGLGTGTTAESAAQTALVTELTTQYSTASTRPTGTLGEKSGDAKTYETTATITVSATVAATEHAILSQAATGGGTMLDRSVFAAVNLASGESLQATYQLTFPSGG